MMAHQGAALQKGEIMKLQSIFLAICMLASSYSKACPTCASSLDDYSPPFFSKNYQAYAQSDNDNDNDEGEEYEESDSDGDNGTGDEF